MRLLLLIFMIALVPLRGWAGDTMVLDMAAKQMTAINNIATPALSTPATGLFYQNTASIHPDCVGHLDAANDAVSAAPVAADKPDDGQCKTCGACQMCHTAALSASIDTAVATTPQHLKRPLGSTLFASALTALRLKPPIS